MLSTYKYTLKLRCVENGEYSNSFTFAYLYKFGHPKKVIIIIIIFENLLECILDT